MADSLLCLTGMAMPLGTPLLPQVSCLTCLCQYSLGSGQCTVIRMKTLPSYEKQQVSQSNKYFSQTNISILCHLYIQHKINLHFTKDKGILKDFKCMKVFTLRLGSI